MHRPPGDHTAIVVCSQHPARICLPDISGIGESVVQRVDPPCVEACPQGAIEARGFGGLVGALKATGTTRCGSPRTSMRTGRCPLDVAWPGFPMRSA